MQSESEINVYVRPRKDRPGWWEVDIRGGDRGRSRKQFGSEAEAKAFAAEAKYVARVKCGLVEDRTVRGMVDGYLASLRDRAEPLAEKTLAHRQEMLVSVVNILGSTTSVDEISESEIARFIKVRRDQVKPSTLRHNLWAFQQALRWSCGQGWIDGVPEIEIPKKPKPRQVWLRSDEVEAFLQACSEIFRPLAEAAIYFGLREGELCVTEPSDFDLSAGVLWVREKPEIPWKPKNESSIRGIPLVGRGREIAGGIVRSNQAWAWPNRKGGRRVPGTWFSRATRRAAEAAGIDRRLVFHDLRRTFGAMMIEAEVHIRAVQQALGHWSVRTTEEVYAPISTKFLAAGMEKMDKHLERKAAEYAATKIKPPPRRRLTVVK